MDHKNCLGVYRQKGNQEIALSKWGSHISGRGHAPLIALANGQPQTAGTTFGKPTRWAWTYVLKTCAGPAHFPEINLGMDYLSAHYRGLINFKHKAG